VRQYAVACGPSGDGNKGRCNEHAAERPSHRFILADHLLPPLLAAADNAAMEAEPNKAAPPKRKRRWYQFSLQTLLYDTRPARPLYRVLAIVVAAAYTAAIVYFGFGRGLCDVVWGLIPIYVFYVIVFTGRLPSFRIKDWW
jgi:hypothetical protein